MSERFVDSHVVEEQSAAEWLDFVRELVAEVSDTDTNYRACYGRRVRKLEAMLRDAKAELDGIPARLEELAKHLRNSGPGGEAQRIAEHDACLIAAGYMKDRWDAIEAKWRNGKYR